MIFGDAPGDSGGCFLAKNSCNFLDMWYNKQNYVVRRPYSDKLGGSPMAENKQYIMQSQDGGRVFISEDVVAAIVLQALNEVEGFAGLSTKPGADIADLIGKKWGKGIKISISDSNEMAVECNVLAKYGASVVTVAREIQTRVLAEVESIAGVKVAQVDVNVCGIVRK